MTTTTWRLLGGAAVVSLAALAGLASAQSRVNTTPSRETLEEAAQNGCDGVSVVVARCAGNTEAPVSKTGDPLARSRAAAKAAFDRRAREGRATALDGSKAPASGDAQRLGPVTVTGRTADDPTDVEGVLQRALNPNSEGTLSADGKTISRYGLNGSRFDCVAKCVGPACCVEVRALPNPARDSNSIGR